MDCFAFGMFTGVPTAIVTIDVDTHFRGRCVPSNVNSSLERVKKVYLQRGPVELLRRLSHQITYQFSERIFGSRWWFQFRLFINNRRNETVQNAYKIEWINPKDVKYRSARAVNSSRNRWKEIGLIIDGNWDLESKSSEYAIENELLYQAIEAHFERGIPWEETEYVEKSLERLRQGNHEDTWRAVVRSEEDLWERCEQLDELYDQIQTDGYKSKRDVFDSQLADPMGYYPRTFKYMLDEVMIDRGHDGEPLLVDGQHRLFIAKVCGVEKIPVLVAVRHREYVNDQ